MRVLAAMILLAAVCCIPAPAYAASSDERALVGPASSLEASLLRTIGEVVTQNEQDVEQERYLQAARSKQRRGRLLMLMGVGIIGGGVAMFATDTGVMRDCDVFLCTVDYRVPGLVTLSGAGVLVLGVLRQRDGGRAVREVEAQRKARDPQAGRTTIPLGERSAFTIGGGGVAVTHTLAW